MKTHMILPGILLCSGKDMLMTPAQRQPFIKLFKHFTKGLF